MKIENQCCTLEQAKRLKELGIKQDSHFAWINEGELISRDKNPKELFMLSVATDFYAALTVAELGVMLPNALNYKQERCIIIFQNNLNIHFDDEKRFLTAIIQAGFDQNVITRIYGETEAEARAAMLIYLLENNLITAEEVNQRLFNA